MSLSCLLTTDYCDFFLFCSNSPVSRSSGTSRCRTRRNKVIKLFFETFFIALGRRGLNPFCPSRLIEACDRFLSLAASHPPFCSSSPITHFILFLHFRPRAFCSPSSFPSHSLPSTGVCLCLSVCLSGILCVACNPLSAAVKSVFFFN